MPRRYMIYRVPTSITVAIDAIEIACADDKMIEVLASGAYQEGTADMGDAQAEVLSADWIRGNTTSGSGGASYTPVPVDPGDAACGAAIEVGNTTAASSGTAVLVRPAGGINVQIPYDRPFIPEERIYTTQAAGLLCLRMRAAPLDAIIMGWWALIQEWG